MIYLEEAKKLKPETRKEFAKRQLQEDYRRSLGLFAKDLLGYKDLNTRTHGEVVRALESPTKRKLLCLPRGCLKTSLCSIAYPIWLLLNNPNLRILVCSELYTNSKNILREIKQHLEGDALTSVYGQFKTDSCWNEGEIVISQRKKIVKEASITAGGLETQKTGQHYDVLCIDDASSPSNSNTPEGRQKVIDHYKYLCAIAEPTATMVIVGTRYAANDLIGWLLENEINQKPLGLL